MTEQFDHGVVKSKLGKVGEGAARIDYFNININKLYIF
jgi:hypothetical protein